LGIELFAYGAKKNVVRVSNTHPIGVPYIGDQVVGVNGKSLFNLQDDVISKDVLGFISAAVKDKKNRPIVLRLQRSSGEMAAGEEEVEVEARRGFSVLFMSSWASPSTWGVAVVDKVRPVFTAPRATCSRWSTPS